MDEIEIRHTFELLKQDNEVIEVRVIKGKYTSSGYFKNIDNLLKEVKRYEAVSNVYFVLNAIDEACYSREQCERLVENVKNSTSDNDIINRDWLLIDVDPKRATGVSASNEEKSNSKETINRVYGFLRDFGFSEPIVADSGNGYHLLYKINCENNSENKETLQKVLQVLDMYFSNEICEIDKSVFNAARITKLYGTTARKGNSSEQRPHRESKILRAPSVIKETPLVLLQKVALLLPQPEKATYANQYGREQFDLRSFISKNGIQIKSEQAFGNGTKFILEHCLFDPSHKGKDAAIFQMSNGAIGYKCLHNSCSHYKWQDVRKMYEPNAYNRDYTPTNRITKPIKVEPQPEQTDKGNKFLNVSDIKNIDRSQIVTIPSGFSELDRRIIGFNKGEITLWSGKNGSAKSTIINQLSLNAVEQGFKGVIFSGELPAHKMKNWLHLQAAGRQFTTPTQYENVYFVKNSVSDKIDKWLKNKLFVYNNDYGNNFEQLIADVEQFVTEKEIDFVVLDNLMAIDLLTLDGDKYEKQTRFINRLCSSVKKYNYHLHIVAHPRKNIGFLRKEDISGTADLTNAVDNVIICHRNNRDYEKAVTEFYGKEMVLQLTAASNYLEVCKNRDLGIVDALVGLYFEIESKRLLNERHENKVYSWQEIEQQAKIEAPTFYHEPTDIYFDEQEVPF